MKTLALDLGTSSIGWVLRDTDFDKSEQFIKYGVQTFNKGVGEEKGNEYSFAGERTKKRSGRRLYQSRKYKLWTTLRVLKEKNFTPISEEGLKSWTTYDKKAGLTRKYPVWDAALEKWIKLDFDNDGNPDFESPYQLRKYLLENQLDFSHEQNRYMLGRALYHIAQHRAFKSSKKVKLEDDEKENSDIGAEKMKKENLKKEFEKLNIHFDENKEIGQLLAEVEHFFKTRGFGRIRNELHPYVTRKMLQQEVEQVFKFQFGPSWIDTFSDIFGTDKIAKCCIFWQRPLRSQKSTVGKCTLEKSKYRCPVSHPQFELFRAWSFINNIRYKNGQTDEDIIPSIDLKTKLFQEVFVKANDFYFSTIKKWFYKELHSDKLLLNFSDKTLIPSCPSIYYLNKISGCDCLQFKIPHDPIERKKKRKDENAYELYTSKKCFYNYEDIWHVAFQLDDEEEIQEIARNKFQFTDEQIKTYLRYFNNISVDYSRLCLKAIKNINYFLQKGFIYSDAVLLAKIPDLLKSVYNQDTENLITNSLSDIIANNRYSKQIISITNNIISEYKLNKYVCKDYHYQLQPDDFLIIENHCKNFYGEKSWLNKSNEEKEQIKERVIILFQEFITDIKREYKELPKLQHDLGNFLKDNFESIDDKNLSRLYHPSAIDIYPKLTEKDREKDGKIYLQSPKTGSWKNPVAMRALQELRQLTNYLIQTEQIDEQTRIVVEIPRELNDANKRKAYETWQKRKEIENTEYSLAIGELLKQEKNIKADPNNSDDIDKFRIWFEQCFDETTKEFTDKGENKIKSQKKKKKEDDDNINIWEENNYEKINSSLWFKILKAKDNVLEKYKLWREQNAICVYTGCPISIVQLFSEDTIDIEHTLPYSKSLDNSLENKTVCFKEYNRKIKQNRIPSQCPDYENILKSIKPWDEKIKSLTEHLDYWKNETKKASTEDRKNQCIQQKHLWSWELQYWKNKVGRFKMKEITSGFVKAQLVDTQIISKYAFHYLKTLFEKVQVQKGQITFEFSKILGLRDIYERKDRSSHYHHAIDALVLSIIPDSSRLKRLLEIEAEIEEILKGIQHLNESERHIKVLRKEILEQEKESVLAECRINKEFIFKAIGKIKSTVVVNNIIRQKVFSKTTKVISKGKLKGKITTGDTVRGQLHKDSFYGKIKLVERDENGKPKRDENHEWLWKKDKSGHEEFAFVKRCLIDENLKIENIVDPIIQGIVENAVKEKSLKEMKKEGGLFHTDKKGVTKKIRHVRCFVRSTELLEIKKQAYLSEKDYKNVYYADNAENIFYALYENEKGDRTFEIRNLFDAIRIKKVKPIENAEDFFEPTKLVGRGKNATYAKIRAILYPGQKVIFYKEIIDELKELPIEKLNERIYKIYTLYGKIDGRIQFQYHLEARPDGEIKDPSNPQKKLVGFSKINFDNLQSRYLLSPSSFNFAIEYKDFIIKPDGEIEWLF